LGRGSGDLARIWRIADESASHGVATGDAAALASRACLPRQTPRSSANLPRSRQA
jgi:hypothetical protein